MRVKLRRFCSNAFCHCSSVICSVSPAGGPPALCTTISRPPYAETAASTRRFASLALLTSATSAFTSALVSFVIAAAAASMRP
jgi:hypothetical protein